MQSHQSLVDQCFCLYAQTATPPAGRNKMRLKDSSRNFSGPWPLLPSMEGKNVGYSILCSFMLSEQAILEQLHSADRD